MQKIIKMIKQFFCKHKYKKEIISYDYLPSQTFHNLTCVKCGKIDLFEVIIDEKRIFIKKDKDMLWEIKEL